MARKRQRIQVNELREGMFVAELDRPWHETPFPLQGFYIRDEDEVRALAKYCKSVYIDMLKQSNTSSYAPHARIDASGKNKQTSAKIEKEGTKLLKLPAVVIRNKQQYETKVSLRKEVSKARKLHAHVYEALGEVFAAVQQGAQPSVKETEQVAEGMVESVVRNPDALVWLAKMHDADVYTYQHGIRASIWALVFGRHLGLEKKSLKTLAMGTLLMQLGKLKIDPSLLEQSETLQGDQRKEYETYVERGVEVLREMNDIPKGVLAIAEYHRERHNGSGFPKGLTGDRIPLLAKIAGMVDVYQSMIDPKDPKAGLSPLDAAGKLYTMRNITFQQDLVERFIEAIGVYPTGTLVELSSGELAIVTGHHSERRLLPEVMVVCDANKEQVKKARIVDLMAFNENRSQHDQLVIRGSLAKGAFGIDERQYLDQGAGSRWTLRGLAGQLLAG